MVLDFRVCRLENPEFNQRIEHLVVGRGRVAAGKELLKAHSMWKLAKAF